MFKVVLSKPDQVLFEGLAESVYLPGEYGEFEVLSFHSQIMSVLKEGLVRIDDRIYKINEGIARFNHNNELFIMVES